MLIRGLTELGFKKAHLLPHRAVIYAHTATCPGSKGKGGGGGGGSKGGGQWKVPEIKRAERSGPVRFGFIPDEWFTFFHCKTGVSGPYIFGLVFTNYMVSKEIFVMEHEYYCGLSIVLIVYWVTVNLGPSAGAALDVEVDAVVEDYKKGRNDEIALYNEQIKAAKDAQWRAEGQKLLMDAKKENILMQLEAIYRERMMHVYKSVRGRMDYQVKKYRSETRIKQKWMIGWILENVRKSITSDFEKQALESAIRDLASASGRA